MKRLLFFLLLATAAFGQMSSTGSISASGTNCFTTNACISLHLINSVNASTANATVTIAGSFTGTLQFEASADNGVTFVSITGTPVPSGSGVTSATAAGVWTFSIAAFTDIRVRASAFSANSATVTINSSTISQTIVNNITQGGSSSSGISGPAQNTWSVQTTPCGSNTSCTQIFGDGKVVIDAVTNSTNTITSATAAFTQADVGKSVWAVQRGAVYAFSAGTLICGNSNPVPTITTVNSATSITISGSACTASTSSVILTWGHKDGATLAAMSPGCATVYLPANVDILVDQPFLITPPACASASGPAAATGIPQPSIFGQSSNTQLIWTPDFNWANCTGSDGTSSNVCFGSGLSQIWELGIWGTGPTNGSVTNCANANGKVVMAANPAGGAIYFVNISGICTGAGTLIGAELNSQDEEWFEGGVQNVGLTAVNCTSKGVGVLTKSLDNHNLASGVSNAIGENIAAGCQQTEEGTFANGCTVVIGKLTTRNAHFVTNTAGSTPCSAAVSVNSGGVWQSDGDVVNQDSFAGAGTAIGVIINAGGTVISRNTSITATNATGTAISNSGLFLDHGGNTVTGTPLVSLVPSTTSGDQAFYGSCTGTASAATTIQLTNLGMNNGQSTTTMTCTAAASTSGPSVSRIGSLKGFTCSSTAQGVNASSGVCTVLKNNVATALTCTIGNAAPSGNSRFYCVDNTHTVATAVGDIITVQITTQAAETLANLNATLLAW